MKVVPYARVSTPEQAKSGTSYARQDMIIRAGAAKRYPGVSVSDTIYECVSGYKSPTLRKGLMRAIASLESGDVLMVEAWDRLARGFERDVKALVEERGARIESLGCGDGTQLEDSRYDSLYKTFASMRDAMEVYYLSRRRQEVTSVKTRHRDIHE